MIEKGIRTGGVVITFIQIEYFLEVARRKNITRAAETFYVSQQVMSKQIQAIERELDIKLMERTRSGIILTDAGQHLYQHWDKMMAQNALEITQAKQLALHEKIVLRVGIQEISHIMDVMMPVFARFRSERKNIDIQYVFGTPVALYEKLKKNKIDAIIAFSSETDLLEDVWKVQFGNMGIRFGLIVSNTSEFAGRDEVTVRDIQNETILIPKMTYSIDAEDRTLNYLEKRGLVPHKVRYYDNISALEMAVSMNEGVAVAYNALFRNIHRDLKFYEWDNILEGRETEIVMAGHAGPLQKIANEMKEFVTTKWL